MFFASMPIVIYAIFDQEYSDVKLTNFPHLYVQGMKGIFILKKKKI